MTRLITITQTRLYILLTVLLLGLTFNTTTGAHISRQQLNHKLNINAQCLMNHIKLKAPPYQLRGRGKVPLSSVTLDVIHRDRSKSSRTSLLWRNNIQFLKHSSFMGSATKYSKQTVAFTTPTMMIPWFKWKKSAASVKNAWNNRKHRRKSTFGSLADKSKDKKRSVSIPGRRPTAAANEIKQSSLYKTTNFHRRNIGRRPSTTLHESYQTNSDRVLTETVLTEDSNVNSDVDSKMKNQAPKITLRVYHNPNTNITLKGLEVSLSKFKSWVNYYHMHQNGDEDLHQNHFQGANVRRQIYAKNENNIESFISSKQIEVMDSKVRGDLRQEWLKGRLICERTEILASYPSNTGCNTTTNSELNKNVRNNDNSSNQQKQKRKRGGFDDLLSVYADRLVGILQDEIDDSKAQKHEEEVLLRNIRLNDVTHKKIETVQHNYLPPISMTNSNVYSRTNPTQTLSTSTSPKSTGSYLSSLSSTSPEYAPLSSPASTSNAKKGFVPIQTWLRDEYGTENTHKLCHSIFSKLDERDQLETMQHFLDWFRKEFPYFYDKCDACGASYREDDAAQAEQSNVHNIQNQNLSGEDDDEEDSFGSFLGYVCPTVQEEQGKASRTELYHCHKCHHYTRFPRYNAVSSIISHKRGRCGEYSILLYRILRDLGYNVRWVVDWADHLWTEYYDDTRKRWIHLDPCEAAVDKPLLYQDWGKKQTYIVAFWIPPQWSIQSNSFSINHSFGQELMNRIWIEDVTQAYTTDSLEHIRKRREASDDFVRASISTVNTDLHNRIQSILRG